MYRVQLHPEDPQSRIVEQISHALLQGAVIVLPTDSGYSLSCAMDQKEAMARIAQIRAFDKHHLFTLLCHDLSSIANCAKVSNSAFRLMKAHTPGPFTFILEASKNVPKRLWETKRKTIGLRIPDNPACQAILAVCPEPIMVVSLQLPSDEEAFYYYDTDWIEETLGNQVDWMVDVGSLSRTPSTVVDLTEEPPVILRQGAGVFE